jgi:hypothetical protein
MVDLLPNSKGRKEKDYIGPGIPGQTAGQKKDKAPKERVDINRYKDPEGVTMQALERSLWFASHRAQMIFLLQVILVLVALAAWGYFLYGFGAYLVFGISHDNRQMRSLVMEGHLQQATIVALAPQSLEFGPVFTLETNDDKYDLAVQMENPNPYHLGTFQYEFVLGEGERVIESGQGYILPGQSKFLMALDKQPLAGIEDATLQITELNWQRLDRHIYPDWPEFEADHLRIQTDGIEFIPAKSSILTDKMDLSELHFTVSNATPYNYWRLELQVALYDSVGRLIGVNRMHLTEFVSDQSRQVELTWPGRLGNVDQVKIQPNVNILDPESYMKFDVSEAPGIDERM